MTEGVPGINIPKYVMTYIGMFFNQDLEKRPTVYFLQKSHIICGSFVESYHLRHPMHILHSVVMSHEDERDLKKKSFYVTKSYLRMSHELI